MSQRLKVVVVGAGWAGLAAAVEATRLGHHVTVVEAAREPGGRARSLPSGDIVLDNGQHILIGAYTACLQLMTDVGVDVHRVLKREPLNLRFPDGQGLGLPPYPAPLDALAGILRAKGWSWADKVSLLWAATLWQTCGFACDDQLNVAELCRQIRPRVMQELIKPLCVSALNTPAAQSSASVFLRVISDSLFAGRGGSNLLLPRAPLGALFPQAAIGWLQAQGAAVRLGQRAVHLQPVGRLWQLDTDIFDAVLLACPAWEAARLVEAIPTGSAWASRARALEHTAITTVYLQTDATLAQAMLALRGGPDAPAQFVFDRGQLGGPAGLLAFVISASTGSRDELQGQVLRQARTELGISDAQPVLTVVEKRATFACTPGLQRPAMEIAPALLACGDYVAGPYPATLEGAVRHGLTAARMLTEALS